ncbi:MAG: C10 family peptidase [Muribaculaceae bacterium]|nr:C10 family peptidase [Muribaculaceae bacterium]
MTKHLQQLACATLLLGSALAVHADRVSQQDAQSIASEFMSARTGRSADQIVLSPVPSSDSKPLYYVFNAENNGGFVIISAESSATPVLGYSFTGGYNVGNAPEAFRWMMNGLEREIKAAPAEQTAHSATELRNMARRVGRAAAKKELNTPKWSQEAPFNNMIPGRPLVGCVGTAMATVMKYYGYPAKGSGSYDGVSFDTAYDWSNMRTDNYRSGYTTAEGDAVALLMYHASKSIDTQYAMSGSSAYEVRVPGALTTYFGYDPGVSYKKRAEVATQAAWDRIVKNEIDEGRPVIYCGQDVTAGHAFVCDGYEGDYLHFNWGWGGSADGYFLSTALNPTVSRTHHYNNLNTIIYNIKPGNGTITEWSPIHITADGGQPGIGSNLSDLASGQTFDVRVGNLKNLTYDDFNGKIAVALYGKDGNLKTLLSTPVSLSLPSMATLYSNSLWLRNCKLPAGSSVAADDCIRIATQAAGGSGWLPVAGELPTINELAVSISAPASFTITLPQGVAGVNIEGAGSVIRGWDYSFTATPATEDDVITIKANGYVLTPNGNKYTISNVCDDQNVTVSVQKASEVKAKRSIWVETPGTLSSLIPESETGTVKELSLFGSIDARDFAFIRNSMRPERVDISGVYIAAYGTDQANALPRDAFRGLGSLREAILPKSLTRLNNGCFRQTGITAITLPAGIKTYEYNVFCAASRLQDIYVGRESAEFINWCVLSGVKVATATLHVPNERALANYKKAENWNTIANIIVDPIAESDDATFAVMEDNDVRYDSETLTGKMAKGTVVNFTCEYIPDNDNRMEVYANSTLLTPDAKGIYTVTVNGNTIIHFNVASPTEVDKANNSPWTLTDKLGSVGLLTDAVNVIPGQEFDVRVNTLNIPQYYDQYFWAIALTDANDNIKEFISPVNLWTAGSGDSFKMTVNCCVRDSKVREGNNLRLVTSGNKRTWNIVKAKGEDVVDYLSAINNQKPIYNVTCSEVKGATVSGIPETAVHGRDITIKVTPTSAANRIDMTINDKLVAHGVASLSYIHVVKEDTEIDIKVYDPKAEGTVTYNVQPGELYKAVTAESVAANVVVTGETYASDLSLAFSQSFAQKTIKKLDLTGLTIVANPGNSSELANTLPQEMFYKASSIGAVIPVLEEILLPNTVVRIVDGAFKNCANLREIRLPESLTPERIEIGKYASGSIKYGYSLGSGIFVGCTNLKTIYLPAKPITKNGRSVVSFFNPGCVAYGYGKGPVSDPSESSYNLGHVVGDYYDASRTTLVVPAEYLSVYRTYNNDSYYGNPWQYLGYNIVSENPVYGVEYDPAHVTLVDKECDIRSIAQFLGENVALESMTIDNKLKLVNPDADAFIFDNGDRIYPTAEGYIPVTFLNPAKNTEGVGNHTIQVLSAYDVAFNTTSDLFTISEPEVINNIGYKSGDFDRSEALAPVLKSVAENSSVRFRIDYSSEHADAIESHVMVGQQELSADEDGYYTVDVTNAPRTVEIFAVPTDGATLNADEIASLSPEQTEGISSIALTGKISNDDLAQALNCFPGIENLDLSDMEGELAEGAFAGMAALTVISLPDVTEISDNMFNGCTSLQSVDVPASVVSIGDGAFKDCKSLEKINLTGIDNIGEGAFSGCDNLTCITLLTDHTSKPQETKGRRAAGNGVNEKAFDGLNPNCFIILDEGVTLPVAKANLLYTTSGMISETQPDGSVIEREGRIYSAKSDVAITTQYPVTIPHTFSLTNDATISLTADNDKWRGLVVPFDVETITDAQGNAVEISKGEGLDSKADANYLYTLEENGDGLVSVATIKANQPYLFHSATEGTYTFAAKSEKVASTPAVITVTGKDYMLNATYTAVEKPAAETYLLNDKASAFVPASENNADENDAATVELRPFEVYATSPVPVSEIQTDLPDATDTTVIDTIEMDVETLTVSNEGGRLVIYSPENSTLTVYDLDGRALTTINVISGRNVIDLHCTGIVIIANTKVKL